MISLHEVPGSRSEYMGSIMLEEALAKSEANFDEIVTNLSHIQAFKRGVLTFDEAVTGEDEYHRRNSELGWDFVKEAIGDNGGIPILIRLSEPQPIDPQAIKGPLGSMNGILTDISGGRRVEGVPLFDGLAVLRADRNGRQDFVAISLGLDGTGYLKSPEFHPKFPENWRLLSWKSFANPESSPGTTG